MFLYVRFVLGNFRTVSLLDFGPEERKTHEPSLASLRIPCLLVLKKFEEARRLTQLVCREHNNCLRFYRVLFQIASHETDEVYPKTWLHDLTEILKHWDGTYKPFQNQGPKMPLASHSLLPFLKPLVHGAIHHRVSSFISVLLKTELVPLSTVFQSWLAYVEPEQDETQVEASKLELFKKSIHEVEKKSGFGSDSEPAVWLLFLSIQAALLEQE